ncbi:MAG: hypothetical protein AVDCRST_MAG33-2044 [uncultured Thermomicrobiales bacterium]|uniref:Uncharacterized protein n=1 Tax=uncultured Thermomicrobiales bacterium TaxID=1645740 RepID=A0A6J4V3P4_9BACT|nr:MAG: hypothetical protein AVDCRST_MAG33-2044 [uncultured Thermomicrobiales bacterium]
MSPVATTNPAPYSRSREIVVVTMPDAIANTIRGRQLAVERGSGFGQTLVHGVSTLRPVICLRVTPSRPSASSPSSRST